MTSRASWMTALLFTALVSSCASSTTSPTRDAEPTSERQTNSTDHFQAVPSTPVAPETDLTDACGHEWSALVAPLFIALGADAEITTTSVGQGCRSTSLIGDAAISVLLEPVGFDVIDDVTAARHDSTALMGFVELDFVASDAHVSSSLLHPENDRLIENRWHQLDATSAMRLEVTIGADGERRRDLVLTHIAKLEVDGASFQHAVNSVRGAAVAQHSADVDLAAVSNALSAVLQRVADTRVLGSLATNHGADAIAFEYAFPDNFVALADVHRPDDCSVDLAGAHCALETAGAIYRFTFTYADDLWLLDDFEVSAQQPPSTSNEE